MADILDLFGFGNSAATNSARTDIDQFNQQNLSPTDVMNAGSSMPRTIGGIPGIGSRIPGLGSIPIPGISAIDKALAPINQFKFGTGGTWESLQYSDDLNSHHPKFKFLFKVGFYGFPGNDFYHYVLRADKPKVRFQHQDVNYYNFRTRVLTGVVYEPLSITFFDEIGNTLNNFFAAYLKERSGTGTGKYGIDRGFAEASSSNPYKNGYSEQQGQRIILEQVFANGTQSNRYIFVNPRIENFDFDEVSMEDSTAGSHATVTFTYDAIEMMTVYGSTIHSWGNVDLLRGGGTSGKKNGGSTSGIFNDVKGTATGFGIDGSIPKVGGNELFDAVRRGSDMISNLPGAAMGYVMGGPGSAIRNVADTVSQGIQNTLKSITSGSNASELGMGTHGTDDYVIEDPVESQPLGDWSYE